MSVSQSSIVVNMMYLQEGYSALIEAVRWGETRVVKELMKRGAALNLQSKVCQ